MHLNYYLLSYIAFITFPYMISVNITEASLNYDMCMLISHGTVLKFTMEYLNEILVFQKKLKLLCELSSLYLYLNKNDYISNLLTSLCNYACINI